MSDELLSRLRTFGCYAMDEDGNLSEFHPNPMTTAAAEEIAKLQALGDALVGCIKMQMWETLPILIGDWEEARRG